MRDHEHDVEFQHDAAAPVRRRRDDAARAQTALTPGAPPAVQRAALLDLQRAAGNASAGSLIEDEEDAATSVRSVVGSGGGQPLDRETRGFMEAQLGSDFSDVRVHTDDTATKSAQQMSARAYTVGNDVVFQRDHYAPDTDAGKHVLAHELTHVVQQRSGPVSGTDVGGGVKVSDPSDSFEQAAEHSASQVMAAQPTPAAGSGAAVQREAMPEEEELQMSPAVQRAGMEEEEEELQMSAVQRAGMEEEEEELQMSAVQRQGMEEEEEELQMSAVQRQGMEEEEELQMSRAVEENEEEVEEEELAAG